MTNIEESVRVVKVCGSQGLESVGWVGGCGGVFNWVWVVMRRCAMNPWWVRVRDGVGCCASRCVGRGVGVKVR